MVRVEDIVWREIEDDIVVIKDDGLSVYVLNKTAARIWEMCTGDFEPDEIAANLFENFEVPLETARVDVRNITAKMLEVGILKVVDRVTD